ncbi:hypothetical protein [Propionivibrio sp.]|uniref:hypothetical protein n=1 Tax=Propionivibrio sp. TaxID=2212460 RepID=UPI003BF0838A
MSEGNLPALSDCNGAVYEIYTTAADQTALEANANFVRMVNALGSWGSMGSDSIDPWHGRRMAIGYPSIDLKMPVFIGLQAGVLLEQGETVSL